MKISIGRLNSMEKRDYETLPLLRENPVETKREQ
jgi:hypothetical protein